MLPIIISSRVSSSVYIVTLYHLCGLHLMLVSAMFASALHGFCKLTFSKGRPYYLPETPCAKCRTESAANLPADSPDYVVKMQADYPTDVFTQ